VKSSCARWQLFPTKADSREVHVHNRISQLAHRNFAISAGGQYERRDDGNALDRVHHGDHRIEIIEDGAPRNENPGAGAWAD
jgi:hypothetical protein